MALFCNFVLGLGPHKFMRALITSRKVTFYPQPVEPFELKI